MGTLAEQLIIVRGDGLECCLQGLHDPLERGWLLCVLSFVSRYDIPFSP